VKTFVLTDIPSPYQVELFNEITAQKTLDLSVAYLRNSDPARMWQPAQAQFDCRSIDGFSEARRLAMEAEVAVFNYYNHPLAEQLIRCRAQTGKPWCFWGERPGLRKPKFAGTLFRKWKLKLLRRSHAPIWGVGQFALQQYKHEFGNNRIYRNVPYFSNLDRFIEVNVTATQTSSRRVFLFCGSLSFRKGVDLVARAFVRLVREVPNVHLRIVGDGDLRELLGRILRPVNEQVEFVGFTPWDQLPNVYSGADVLCVPSRHDGWGLVVPEGLAAGLPVIGSNRMGAALDLLTTGKNGWLTRSGDEDSVFRAMREAATLSNERLSQVALSARATVANHSLSRGAERVAHYAYEAVESWN